MWLTVVFLWTEIKRNIWASDYVYKVGPHVNHDLIIIDTDDLIRRLHMGNVSQTGCECQIIREA